MKLEEFLEDNAFNLTPEEYNQALADLDSLDAKSWIDKHAALMQEKTTGWNQVDEVKRSKPLSQRIADAFADSKFNPGRNFKEDVYESDFSDVPKKDFEDALAKMKQYYDSEVDAREKEYLKEKRKKEVADWNLVKSALTSDYEKQRYIEDPESALFGEQAPSLGDAKNTRWGSVADLGLGAVGAAADALPGLFSMAGPAVRTFRDIGHKVTDSPYQKSWKDIGKNAIADAGLSAGTAFLPNFMKYKRMAGKGGMIPTDIQNIVDIENTAKAIDAGRDELSLALADDELLRQLGVKMSEQERRKELYRAFDAMPESPLKKEIEPLLHDVNIDWAKLKAIKDNNAVLAELGRTEAGRNMLRTKVYSGTPSYMVADNADEASKMTRVNGLSVPITERKQWSDPLSQAIIHSKELTPLKKTLKPVAVQAEKLLNGNVGGALLQESLTATGVRSPRKPETVITPEMRDELEQIKQSEARFWEAGFAPKKIEGDPLWEAYNEWKEENKLKNIVKKNILGGR